MGNGFYDGGEREANGGRGVRRAKEDQVKAFKFHSISLSNTRKWGTRKKAKKKPDS